MMFKQLIAMCHIISRQGKYIIKWLLSRKVYCGIKCALKQSYICYVMLLFLFQERHGLFQVDHDSHS